MVLSHYIISTTNEIDLYIEFVPTVYQMWKKNLECIFVLGFITDRSENDPLVKRLKNFCDEIHLFKPYSDIHTGIQAKATRMWLASQYNDSICTLTDIDQYLFDFKWLKKSIKPAFDEQKFVEIGHNAYWGTREEGKFPMYYTTAPSYVFKKITNENNIDNYNNWFLSFKNIPAPIDNKEKIRKDFNGFSDESLLRYLIVKHKDQNFIKKKIIQIFRADFSKMKAAKRVDRAEWPKHLTIDFLKNNHFIDCNPLRPFNKYYPNIMPILKYMNLDINKEKIFL